jgi:[ribosomal protein S5]-alanine N-acetyltransferase
MIAIESPRLCLRDYQSGAVELESVFQFTGDPEVATYSSWGPLTRAETMTFLEKAWAAQSLQPRLNYSLALVVKGSDDLIGNMSLNIRNQQQREAEIGYTVRRDLWNRGYASEAVLALLRFGFQDLGMHRISAKDS